MSTTELTLQSAISISSLFYNLHQGVCPVFNLTGKLTELCGDTEAPAVTLRTSKEFLRTNGRLQRFNLVFPTCQVTGYIDVLKEKYLLLLRKKLVCPHRPRSLTG